MSTAQRNSYLNGYYTAINYGCGLPLSFYEHKQYLIANIQQYLSMDQLNYQPDWYKVKKLYTDAKIDDNKYQFYMMAGQTEKKLKEMVLSQYNQEQ